jgi:hypothetical protein
MQNKSVTYWVTLRARNDALVCNVLYYKGGFLPALKARSASLMLSAIREAKCNLLGYTQSEIMTISFVTYYVTKGISPWARL